MVVAAVVANDVGLAAASSKQAINRVLRAKRKRREKDEIGLFSCCFVALRRQWM